MRVMRLDHIVLTVRDVEASVRFYERLGMRREAFGGGRTALRFGRQKINLHLAGEEIEPHAAAPTPGSADLCLIVDSPLAEVAMELADAGIPVEAGPVHRTGATGPIDSLYVRDPDGNLVELSRPASQARGSSSNQTWVEPS